MVSVCPWGWGLSQQRDLVWKRPSTRHHGCAKTKRIQCLLSSLARAEKAINFASPVPNWLGVCQPSLSAAFSREASGPFRRQALGALKRWELSMTLFLFTVPPSLPGLSPPIPRDGMSVSLPSSLCPAIHMGLWAPAELRQQLTLVLPSLNLFLLL